MAANLLSALRVLLIPFVLQGLASEGQTPSATTLGLILVMGLSDIVDGYVARRWGQPSRVGQIIDPVADKIVLASVGVGLVLWRGFPLWLVLLLLLRDLVILSVGLYLWRRRSLVIPANRLGKYTTVCMGLSVLAYVFPVPPVMGQVLVYLAGLLILASSAGYWKLLRTTPTTPTQRSAP
ncbi:MAG: CDP-alcohol phosphatidyltransferase family protein [Candidatus Latescibacteria bacterium]|nr:CDP-alcohol phosphatidyltransferase family protein [Candidatus Latescibacterota bacterium]